MFISRRFFTLTVTILLVLFASAVWTVPVFADDETPPPTETPVETQPGEESPPPAEPALSADETANENATPETAPAEEAVVDSAAELLASVPEGTEVIVVDENGEAVPLATEEAAQAIVEGDPMWCPVGATPGAASCSPSFLKFGAVGGNPADELLAWLGVNNPNMAGVVWVEKTYNSSTAGDGSVVFDGSALTNMANFALTIKGGWNGSGTGVTTSDPSDFYVPLQIINWNGAITISDLKFEGTAGPALTVDTNSGNVVITRVQVKGNDATGSSAASIDNSGGTGTVTISQSDFNGNLGNGLSVLSKGLITLTDIMAASNDGNGAVIDNLLSTTAAGVTMTGTNVFSDNNVNGLLVDSKGAIKINNLIANANRTGVGADLDNHTAVTAQPVILTGFNEFKFNQQTGLVIDSKGTITLYNITANNNRGDGVSLNNDYTPLPGNVLLAGVNTFNNNYGDGLVIDSYGVLTLNSITANGNGFGDPGTGGDEDGYGASIKNSGDSPKAVALLVANTFNGNYSGGLNILSQGAVTLYNVTANSNAGDGVHVDNTPAGTAVPQNVAVTVTKGMANNFNSNNGDGLDILSYGVITLVNANASDNQQNGARLDNCKPSGGVCAATLPRSVVVSGINTLNNNGGDGLSVVSRGAVSIANLRTSDNSGNGALIDNSYAGTLIPQNVALTGTNVFNANTVNGLKVLTFGAVTLYNLAANDNGPTAGQGYGVYVNNYDPLGSPDGNEAALARNVVLYGVNSFTGNDYIGLYISSLGAITAYNVTANENGLGVNPGSGAVLNNNNVGSNAVASVGSVVLAGLNYFSGNGENGLDIASFGVISLNSISAFGNGASIDSGTVWEASIVNSGAAVPRAVALTGTNKFIGGKMGLYVESKGAITLYNVTASDNLGTSDTGGVGAYIKNVQSGSAAPQNVSLLGVNVFSGNDSTGLIVETYGAVTLYNVTANHNGGLGVDVDNHEPVGGQPATLVRNVALLGVNTFSGNNGDGLHVETFGVITLSTATAKQNIGDGVYLKNQWGSATLFGNISLTGKSLFEDNSGYGLQALSNGAITLSNITASLNDLGGAYLKADGVSVAKNVTLTGINTFNSNVRDGLKVEADGLITISNLTANSNGWNGADLDNYTLATTAVGITLTGSNFFNGNDFDGLHFKTKGVVSMTKVTADDNGEDGVDGQSDNNITIVCGSMNMNGGYGWNFNAPSPKIVTLKGVFAFANNNTASTTDEGQVTGGATLTQIRNCP